MEATKPAPVFRKPLLNAAGSLGYAPDLRVGIPWEDFGAFVTNPISARPRQPANGTRMRTFAGGILLHTGHFNPGFLKILKRFSRRWAQAPLPVIVHLLADRPEEIHKMVVRLETIENIAGVEIGFPADATSDEVVEALAGAAGELTVIARLSLSCAVDLASGVIRAGVSALSLAPPRGALPGHGGELISGRLYGPGVFPQVLLVTSELARQGIPLIAAGGVYRREDADALLDAGALAVQVDAVLWRGDWLERGD